LPFCAAKRRVSVVDGRKIKMANDQTSFDDLVSQVPAATVSVVGTLAKSSESGKFMLVLQNGGTVTLETAAVKGHTVLGTSLGQTIVRVDVDVEKLRDPIPLPWLRVVRSGAAELVPITIGRDYGDRVEVLTGLDAADEVIINPSDSLVSGAAVRLVNHKAGGAA
jgi:multidrug efflux pump subunit AcrA (membrane-fusion protein)